MRFDDSAKLGELMIPVERHVGDNLALHFPFVETFVHRVSRGSADVVLYAGHRAEDGDLDGQLHPDHVISCARNDGEDLGKYFVIGTLEAKHCLAAEIMTTVGTRRQSCDGECTFSAITMGTQTADGLQHLCQVS